MVDGETVNYVMHEGALRIKFCVGGGRQNYFYALDLFLLISKLIKTYEKPIQIKMLQIIYVTAASQIIIK